MNELEPEINQLPISYGWSETPHGELIYIEQNGNNIETRVYTNNKLSSETVIDASSGDVIDNHFYAVDQTFLDRDDNFVALKEQSRGKLEIMTFLHPEGAPYGLSGRRVQVIDKETGDILSDGTYAVHDI